MFWLLVVITTPPLEILWMPSCCFYVSSLQHTINIYLSIKIRLGIGGDTGQANVITLKWRICRKNLVFFLVAMVTCSRSLSENGSVISNESGKPNSCRGSPQKVTAQQKVTKEEGRKRNGEKCALVNDLLNYLPFLPWR